MYYGAAPSARPWDHCALPLAARRRTRHLLSLAWAAGNVAALELAPVASEVGLQPLALVMGGLERTQGDAPPTLAAFRVNSSTVKADDRRMTGTRRVAKPCRGFWNLVLV